MNSRVMTFALFAFGLSASGEATAEPTSTGWVLGTARGGKVASGRGYRLLNVYNKLYVDVRPGKVPTVDTSAAPVDTVDLVTSTGGELRCGDPFTLRVATHTLVFDTKSGRVVPTGGSAEEWKFLGCKVGTVVPLGVPLALVNVKRGDAWVGCKHLGTATYCWDDKQLMGIATE